MKWRAEAWPERGIVQLCAEALRTYRELGYAQLAPLAQLSWCEGKRETTLRLMYDLMPFISMRLTELLPGFTVNVVAGEPLRVTSDPDAVRPMLQARTRRVHTMLDRLRHEAAPFRNSADLIDRMRVRTYDQAWQALADGLATEADVASLRSEVPATVELSETA